MRSTPATGILLATNERRTRDVRKCSDLAITQCNVNMLPFPILCSSQQGCHDRVRRVKSSGQICDCHAHFDRWSISFTSYVHQAHFPMATLEFDSSRI